MRRKVLKKALAAIIAERTGLGLGRAMKRAPVIDTGETRRNGQKKFVPDSENWKQAWGDLPTEKECRAAAKSCKAIWANHRKGQKTQRNFDALLDGLLKGSLNPKTKAELKIIRRSLLDVGADLSLVRATLENADEATSRAKVKTRIAEILDELPVDSVPVMTVAEWEASKASP